MNASGAEALKRKRLCAIDAGEDRARVLLVAFADNLRSVRQTQASLTVAEVWRKWMAERKKDGFSNKIYEQNWKAMEPHFGARKPDLLKPDDWREYARQRFEIGRASATVHTELSRLSNCFKWATDEGLIAKRPRHWLPRKGDARDRVLSPDEARSLLIASQAGKFFCEVFVVLLFATGARHTAVLDLEWSRVDFSAGPIDERGRPMGTIDLEIDIPPDKMHKTWRKGRAHVVMSKLARATLEKAFKRRAAAGEEAERRIMHARRARREHSEQTAMEIATLQKKASCSFVIERGGERLRELGDGFRLAAERAGLGWHEESKGKRVFVTDVTPHTIRHTVATWANGKVQTAFTAQLLGHSDEATTRRVYTHAQVESTKPVIDVIDGIIVGEQPGND